MDLPPILLTLGARVSAVSPRGQRWIDVADLFCKEARLRIADHFRNLFGKNDAALYKLSQKALNGELAWLEGGIVRPFASAAPAPTAAQDAARRREPVGV